MDLLVLCGFPVFICLCYIIKASYPSIHKWHSQRKKKAHEQRLYFNYIDDRMLPSAYREFEWWVRSCYIQPTKKDREYILEKSGLIYKTEIAESLWNEKKIWLCSELKKFLDARKQALIEFSHSLAGVPSDLDIEDAKDELMKKFECLNRDILSFHAVGWQHILDDHYRQNHPSVKYPTITDTWVKAQALEAKWLYEESVGKSGLGPQHVPASYEEWSQSYTRKWWKTEWAKEETTQERPNVEYEFL